MKIVVDTNIVFSAILNANSRIASMLLELPIKQIFYTTDQLLIEIERHRNKLKKLTLLSDLELFQLISIVVRQIKFINVELIPDKFYQRAKLLTADIDVNDVEFVALTKYLNASYGLATKR